MWIDVKDKHTDLLNSMKSKQMNNRQIVFSKLLLLNKHYCHVISRWKISWLMSMFRSCSSAPNISSKMGKLSLLFRHQYITILKKQMKKFVLLLVSHFSILPSTDDRSLPHRQSQAVSIKFEIKIICSNKTLSDIYEHYIETTVKNHRST